MNKTAIICLAMATGLWTTAYGSESFLGTYPPSDSGGQWKRNPNGKRGKIVFQSYSSSSLGLQELPPFFPAGRGDLASTSKGSLSGSSRSGTNSMSSYNSYSNASSSSSSSVFSSLADTLFSCSSTNTLPPPSNSSASSSPLSLPAANTLQLRENENKYIPTGKIYLRNSSGSTSASSTSTIGRPYYSIYLSAGEKSLAEARYDGGVDAEGRPALYGIMEWYDGSRYDGWWKNGLRNGKGTYTGTDGTTYKSLWIEDDSIGDTTATYPDGSIYKGPMRDGCREGSGRYTYRDGSTYEGQWHLDKEEGKGTRVTSRGMYSGDFKDDQADGIGIMTYSDWSKYEGGWRKDVREGNGTYTVSGGRTYAGIWADDYPVGRFTITYPDGSIYEGSMSNGLRDGEGTCKYLDGRTVTGKWHDDKYVG